MTDSSTIRWERDDDGVVILTLDDPNQSANTMNAATPSRWRRRWTASRRRRTRSPA
jgi:enoyl-CoA hydratase/carnithine racemase